MVGMSIEVTGIDKVLANLRKIESSIQSGIKPALYNASYKLRDTAIDKYLNPTWPTSVVNLSIRDRSSWNTYDGGMNEVILRSNSPHSFMVEFGTMNSGKLGGDGRFHAQDLTDTGGPFPVGKSQGITINYAESIAPQPAKAFLRQAKDDRGTQTAMLNEVSNILSRAIRSVGI